MWAFKRSGPTFLNHPVGLHEPFGIGVPATAVKRCLISNFILGSVDVTFMCLQLSPVYNKRLPIPARRSVSVEI